MMWNRIMCMLFGHKKYLPKSLGNQFILVSDALNQPLLEVCLCERCGLVYWEAK